MKEPISIIVPTYNRVNLVGRAIQSIFKQTYDKYEVIVIDDGSEDHTQEMIQRVDDSRIRYIRLEHNQGVAHARNIGIRESQYEYIAFLDSDDEWMPDKLMLQMHKMMESSDQVGMIYCRTSGECRDGSGRFTCPPLSWPKDILEGDLFKLLLRQNVIGSMSVLARKECLMESGGFKESLQCLEDWELFLRIARQWQIGFIDEALVEVHKVAGSVSTRVGMYFVVRCYMVSKYRKEMEKYGILDSIKQEIYESSVKFDLHQEIKELLNRDFEL